MRLLLPYGLPSGWRSTASTQVSLPDPATLHHPPPGSHFSRSTGYKTMSDPQRFRERMETPPGGRSVEITSQNLRGGREAAPVKTHAILAIQNIHLHSEYWGCSSKRQGLMCIPFHVFCSILHPRHNTQFLSDQLQFPTSNTMQNFPASHRAPMGPVPVSAPPLTLAQQSFNSSKAHFY